MPTCVKRNVRSTLVRTHMIFSFLTLSMPRDIYIYAMDAFAYTSWSNSWKTCGKLKIRVSVTKENFTEIHIQQKWINFVVIMLNYAFKVNYNRLRYGATWSRMLGTVLAFARSYYSDVEFLFEFLLNSRQHNAFVALLSFL